MRARAIQLAAVSSWCLCACTPVTDGSRGSETDDELQLERDIVVTGAAGEAIRVTGLPGVEEMEVLSPDGRQIAFVGAASGIASVYAVHVPDASGALFEPVQLTNRGLEHVRHRPGQAPAGFVPPPEDNSLAWVDNETLQWTAGGQTFTAKVPRSADVARPGGQP